MSVAMTIGFATWMALLNNFVIEKAAFTGAEIGLLQSIREIPGFLAFTAVFVLLILIPGIFLSAYQSSTIFNKRVNEGFNDIITYSKADISISNGSSIGERVIFALNCWEIIKKNPLIGVGTGDLPNEYKKVNQKNTPTAPSVTNPHNMYTLIMVQLGLVGLISMLSVIFYQIRLSFRESNKFFRDVGITLPLLYLLIMWSDSYLLGPVSYTHLTLPTIYSV